MARYDFKCKTCGTTLEKGNTETVPCPVCGDTLRRDFHFNLARTFQPHFNHSVGKYVSSNHQFKEELKKASETASESSGVEHRYVPVDLGDKSQMTDDGQEQIEAANRTRGWTPKKLYWT